MRIPYRRRPSPVPNATNGRKEKSIACSECHNCQKRGAQCKKRRPGCRREQENHSQKVCNTAPKLLNTSRKSRCRQNPLNAAPKLPNATRIFAANPGGFAMTPKIHIVCPDSTFYGIRRHTFWALILPIGDAHCTLSQLVTGYPYTRKVPYKVVKCHLGAENVAWTRDLNLLARPPQTAFISVDDGSYATDPREKGANEFA